MTGSVVLFGSRSTQSVVCFNALRELGVLIPLVIAGAEDPGADDWRLSLAKAAIDAGYRKGKDLLVLQNPHASEVVERVRGAGADVILSVQWRRILRDPLYGLSKRGLVNLHNAPLPLLRGCDPFSWAIHDGLQNMGVTLHEIVDDGIDSGPILAQRLWPISDRATAWSLYNESLKQADLLLRDSIADILAGRALRQPQPSRFVSYHPMRQFRFNDLGIDWELPAATLSAATRARIFPPFQLPFFEYRNHRIEIIECHAVQVSAEVGQVIETNPLRIAAGRGSIEFGRLRLDTRETAASELAQEIGLKSGHNVRTN